MKHYEDLIFRLRRGTGLPVLQGLMNEAAEAIEELSAADVRPVVKAVWEWNDNNGYYYCGNCKAVSPREDQDGEYIDCPNFCPNCGAEMRGEADGT